MLPQPRTLWRILFGVILAAPVPARELEPQAIADMSLGELLNIPITVASLAPETPRTAPSSVTAFSAREIRNLGVETVEELLNFVPGLQSTRAASRSHYAVGIRGRNRVQLPNDILFLLNGRRLNDDYSGAALTFGRFLSVGNLERVEVIRGPGSALYGSNAFLAVVNMVTRDDANEAYVAAGSHGHREGRLNLSWDTAELAASLYLQAFRDSGESFRDRSANDGSHTRDPRSGQTLHGTLGIGRTEVELRHAAYEVEDFYLFRRTPSYGGNESWAEDTRLSLRHALVEGPERRLEVEVSGRRISNEAIARPFTAAQIRGPAPFLGGPDVELNERHIGLTGNIRLNPDHQLYGGLSYRDTEMDRVNNLNNYETTDLISLLTGGPPGPVRYYGEVRSTAPFGPQGEHRRVRSAYLQDKWAVTDALEVTVGGRWDDYSDFGSSFNPRVGAVFQGGGGNSWKLLYGEAFRAPTVSELGTVNNPARIGNPDLEAEKVRTVELAWLRDAGWLQTTTTAYHSRISERFVDIPVPGDPRTTLDNGDTLHLSGIELEAQTHLGRGWVLRGTWSHLLNGEEDPRTMSRNLGSLIANYHRGPLNLNLSALYRSSVETATNPSETLDGYWRVNTHLRYRLEDVVLIAGLRNVFDEDYGTLSRTPLPGGTPNRGRELRLAVEVPLGD